MSFKATAWAWGQTERVENGNHLLVLLALADLARPREVRHSARWVAKMIHRTERHVRSAIAALEGLGLITTKSRPGFSDIIRLEIPAEFMVKMDPDDDEDLEAGRRGRPRKSPERGDEETPERQTNAGTERHKPLTPRSAVPIELPIDLDGLKELARATDDRPLVEKCAAVYRDIADRWPHWGALKILNDSRRKAIPLRVRDAGGFDAWRDIMISAETSAFLTGKTGANFSPTFDFFLQQSSFTKLHEGFYHRERQSGSPATDPRGDARAASADRRTSNLVAGFALAADRAQRSRGAA
jgi:hypothetical protein